MIHKSWILENSNKFILCLVILIASPWSPVIIDISLKAKLQLLKLIRDILIYLYLNTIFICEWANWRWGYWLDQLNIQIENTNINNSNNIQRCHVEGDDQSFVQQSLRKEIIFDGCESPGHKTQVTWPIVMMIIVHQIYTHISKSSRLTSQEKENH